MKGRDFLYDDSFLSYWFSLIFLTTKTLRVVQLEQPKLYNLACTSYTTRKAIVVKKRKKDSRLSEER